MGNRIENTVSINGFRLNKQNADEIKEYFDGFVYGYMGQDGRHTRPFLTKKSKKNPKKLDVIILEVEADGITIKGWTEHTFLSLAPRGVKLVYSYDELLQVWLEETNELWVKDTDKILKPSIRVRFILPWVIVIGFFLILAILLFLTFSK